jgi:photosystem II stability/assembly factor-like uncharacterized protein
MPVPLPSHRILPWILTLPVLCASAVNAAVDPSLLQGLAARSLGPAAVSGRISAIDAVQSDPNQIVVGAATGGVWISKNGGLTWNPVFDEQPVASIGAVAIDQANPDVIWVGTGEGNTRNSTSIGAGLFKSLDGGKTWRQTGLTGSERINRIALHPHNPDIAYVAALGTLWADNEERGIFKTTDGGKTWHKLLYVNQRTGGTDVKIDPFNPDKIYASLWEHRRWPHFFKSGGPGSGMYISWDGGETWTKKTEQDGLPEGDLGRITFAPSPAQRGRVYALVEAEKSAMLRSDDGGQSWIRTNEDHDIAVRPFYYTEVTADPDNPDRVYNIASLLSVSIDGGKTFVVNPGIACCRASNTIHIDVHAFWVNPADSRHLIVGNDGGIAISRDRGDTWRFVRNLPLSQFYHIAVDNDVPYHIYGGMQDNGSWRGPAEVWENAGIRNLHWQEVGFGDGFDTVPDPENSRRGYVMSQGGYLSRWNLDIGELRMIRPAPPAPGIELRFNWNAGIAQDPFDAATLYYGSQYVHQSADRGETWSVISGDLTTNNPDWQTYKESGGLTYDVTAAENFTTIVAIAPSPLQSGTLWVGTDDGRVHVTRDGGQTWSRIDERARGVPPGSWVPMIAASPHDPGTAFVVFDNHRRGDMQPYAFRVSGYGRDWENLVSDPVSGYALSILQDHQDPGLLFLGTEFGLFVSTDGGGEWFKFSAGVPTVSVMDMAIQRRENDLVLGTHGRSAYVLDDYSALRGLQAESLQQRLQIRSTVPGQQYTARQTPSTRFTGSGEFRAENEPYGVMITFVASGQDLPHPDADSERVRKAGLTGAARAGQTDDSGEKQLPKVEMTIQDATGKTVRRQRFPVHQGLNRVVWNMRHDGVRPLPAPDAPDTEDGLPDGPEVPPGQYRVALSLTSEQGDIATAESPIEVVPDPRSTVTPAAQRQNYEVQLSLQRLRDGAVSSVERIVRLRADTETVIELIGHRKPAAAELDAGLQSLLERAEAVKKDLEGLEERFRVPPETKGIPYDEDRVVNQIELADEYVSSTREAPTVTALAYRDLAERSLDEANAALDRFIDSELAEFRRAVESAGIGLFEAIGEP